MKKIIELKIRLIYLFTSVATFLTEFQRFETSNCWQVVLIWGFWALLCVTELGPVSQGWVWGFQKLIFNQLNWGTKLREWRFVSVTNNKFNWQTKIFVFVCCFAGMAGSKNFRSNKFSVASQRNSMLSDRSLISKSLAQLLRSWVGICSHSFPIQLLLSIHSQEIF